jgi:hypothetical protein
VNIAQESLATLCCWFVNKGTSIMLAILIQMLRLEMPLHKTDIRLTGSDLCFKIGC